MKDIRTILEEHGWVVEKADGYFDLYHATPAGEDWHVELEDLSVDEFRKYVDLFDPEEEFAMWFESRNKVCGVPSIPELWKDQEAKKDILEETLEAMEEGNE